MKGSIKFSILMCFISYFCLSCSPSLEDLAKEKMSTMSAMAELGTVEYTITKIIKATDEAYYTIGERKILFSCSATMKAGIDLSEFSVDNVEIDEGTKTINIMLPAPKVLAFNMPPEKAKLEYQKVGMFRFDFTAEERNKLLVQGEEAILNDVANLGILNDAQKNAKLFFEAMLSQVGFEKINIQFKSAK